MAVVAPAAGDIERAGLDGCDQEREIARVVLAVAVHGEENFAAGGTESVKECGGLPEVARLVECAALWPSGDASGDFGGGGVGAAVVDENDFKGVWESVEDFDGGGDEGGNVARFIVERNDEGVAWGRRHGRVVTGVNTTQRKPGRSPR